MRENTASQPGPGTVVPMTTDAPPPTRRERRAGVTGGTGENDVYTPVIVDPHDAADLPVSVAAESLGPTDDADAPRADADPVVEADAEEATVGEPEASPDTEPEAPEAADPQEPAQPEPTGPASETPDGTAPGTLVVQHPADPPVAMAAGPIALGWVDETCITVPAPDTTPAAPEPDLLAGAKRRSPWRPGVLIPTGLLLGVAGAYAATTLLWPLHEVAPRIETIAVPTAASAAAEPAWPGQGSAAISVAGFDGSLASSGDASSIASITKVVTALLVLDRMPLALGEAGPDYSFTYADSLSYWQYRANGESALDVPVGGTLTQYQMLEGMLLGSANNYADRLASTLWPSDAVFAAAAQDWLATHGVPGITIVDPTGIEAGNTASAEALLTLAQRATANPVIAEIVAKQSVDLPGAGFVTNTNPLMVDPGMVGIKTGTLDAWNLLAAKDVTVGDTTTRVFAAVLGQPSPEARDDATRALFDRVEQEMQLQPSVDADTVAGRVVTGWGESVDVVTDASASVLLWNGADATATTQYSLGDAVEAGDVVGALTVAGPLDSVDVDLRLSDDIEGPSPWWRLTHPLDLFGLNG
jgi:serine-type D-Ala-D-Ala carboxypeptidase (penicillin-binding protein 5/6)